MLSYHYPPFGGVAVQRVLRFSRYLPEFGVKPLVVCAQPPAHTSCPLDRELVVPDGVEVRRVASLEPESFRNDWTRPWDKVRRNLFKTMDLMLVPDDQALWIPRAVAAGRELAAQHRPRLIWATGPPFSTVVAGLQLSRKTGLPLIADFRDDWTGLNGTYRRYQHSRQQQEVAMEQAVFEGAQLLVTVTPGLVADLQRRSVFPERIVLLPNGFDPEQFGSGLPVERTVLYSGTLYKQRDPGPFLRGWERFRGAHPQSDLRFEVIGRVSKECMHYFEPPPAGVEFLGFRSHPEVTRRTQQALLNLVVVDDQHTHQAYSGKLLEYLGAGRPILVIGPHDSPPVRLVEQLGVGRGVPPGDTAGIAQALADAASGRWEWNPDLAAVDAFNARHQTQRLTELLLSRT
jgi:glycosyltransferase involved in cell wall biosynthesis